MKVEVNITDIQSSTIKEMEYLWYSEDDNFKLRSEGLLRVTFQNDRVYVYENVPLIIVMNIAASDSAGESFNFFIKSHNYNYIAENSGNGS